MAIFYKEKRFTYRRFIDSSQYVKSPFYMIYINNIPYGYPIASEEEAQTIVNWGNAVVLDLKLLS